MKLNWFVLAVAIVVGVSAAFALSSVQDARSRSAALTANSGLPGCADGGCSMGGSCGAGVGSGSGPGGSCGLHAAQTALEPPAADSAAKGPESVVKSDECDGDCAECTCPKECKDGCEGGEQCDAACPLHGDQAKEGASCPAGAGGEKSSCPMHKTDEPATGSTT